MEAVIFSGIQAAGKSAFYQAYFFKTHIRINLDMLKTRHREDIFLRACLEAKQPFVVDNTNPTAIERSKYILLAKASRFRVVGYFFESALQDALRRNESRLGRERVPVPAILSTFKKWEVPHLIEGFDRLYRVRLTETGEFFVEEEARDEF